MTDLELPKVELTYPDPPCDIGCPQGSKLVRVTAEPGIAQRMLAEIGRRVKNGMLIWVDGIL
jgi:hypothetical protein